MWTSEARQYRALADDGVDQPDHRRVLDPDAGVAVASGT
jgi:hypothetical protein